MDELEGKIVEVRDRYGNLRDKGKVIGCDPDIGITVCSVQDPDTYHYCLIGPSSSIWKALDIGKEAIPTYQRCYTIAVRLLKEGTLRIGSLVSISETSGLASAETCPFGQ